MSSHALQYHSFEETISPTAKLSCQLPISACRTCVKQKTNRVPSPESLSQMQCALINRLSSSRTGILGLKLINEPLAAERTLTLPTNGVGLPKQAENRTREKKYKHTGLPLHPLPTVVKPVPGQMQTPLNAKKAEKLGIQTSIQDFVPIFFRCTLTRITHAFLTCPAPLAPARLEDLPHLARGRQKVTAETTSPQKQKQQLSHQICNHHSGNCTTPAPSASNC